MQARACAAASRSRGRGWPDRPCTGHPSRTALTVGSLRPARPAPTQAGIRIAEPLDRVQPLRHLQMPEDQRGESAIMVRPAGYPGSKLGLLWSPHVVLLVCRVSDPRA